MKVNPPSLLIQVLERWGKGKVGKVMIIHQLSHCQYVNYSLYYSLLVLHLCMCSILLLASMFNSYKGAIVLIFSCFTAGHSSCTEVVVTIRAHDGVCYSTIRA